MQLLFIGDVVGRPGRRCLSMVLPSLIKKYSIDCLLANGENAAGGLGITAGVLQELKGMGIRVITGGNHIWDNKEIFDIIDREPYLLRPANYPADTTPGRGAAVIDIGGIQIGILNLAGRTFMPPLDCPFRRADEEIDALRRRTKIIIVDFHAEATSEKQALGWYLDGRVSAVIGTHTHVQTADDRLLLKGTAYITDAGMTGLYDSIIGVDRDPALFKFLSQLPGRFTVSEGKKQLNGVVIKIDPESGKARSIKRVFEVVE